MNDLNPHLSEELLIDGEAEVQVSGVVLQDPYQRVKVLAVLKWRTH